MYGHHIRSIGLHATRGEVLMELRASDVTYKCECGIVVSRKRDLKRHERTQRHQDFRCIHHWTIEAANGPLSPGKCENCGKIQTFTNSLIGYSNWFRPDEGSERSAEERRVVHST